MPLPSCYTSPRPLRAMCVRVCLCASERACERASVMNDEHFFRCRFFSVSCPFRFFFCCDLFENEMCAAHAAIWTANNELHTSLSRNRTNAQRITTTRKERKKKNEKILSLSCRALRLFFIGVFLWLLLLFLFADGFFDASFSSLLCICCALCTLSLHV